MGHRSSRRPLGAASNAMVKAVEDAIERNWRLIIGIITMMLSIFGGLYMVTAPMQRDTADIKADIRELRALSTGNFQRIEEFRDRTESSNYTRMDAQRDLDRVWDAIRRLENASKETPAHP